MFCITSRHHIVKHHNSSSHQILVALLWNQILSNNLQEEIYLRLKWTKKHRIWWRDTKSEWIYMHQMKQIPSLPTVAKYSPSVEKEKLLIEPWQICHLAIGLLCEENRHVSGLKYYRTAENRTWLSPKCPKENSWNALMQHPGNNVSNRPQSMREDYGRIRLPFTVEFH